MVLILICICSASAVYNKDVLWGCIRYIDPFVTYRNQFVTSFTHNLTISLKHENIIYLISRLLMYSIMHVNEVNGWLSKPITNNTQTNSCAYN